MRFLYSNCFGGVEGIIYRFYFWTNNEEVWRKLDSISFRWTHLNETFEANVFSFFFFFNSYMFLREKVKFSELYILQQTWIHLNPSLVVFDLSVWE